MYGMDPGQLDRYRRAVADDIPGGELDRIVAAIRAHGIGVEGRDTLKTAPRGYAADHPRIGLLRCKGLVAWQEWPVEPWLETAAARDEVAGFLRTARPLSEWLAAHAGPAGG
jgi:uncharacterized protein (DUF2461 family)